MGKKKKQAPEYATNTVDSGFWGSSTTDKNGTTYKGSDWMNDTMGTVGNNMSTTLNNMLSNDYANDPNFQTYQNQLNNTAMQNYDTSVLSQLANRGLMRSSGLQSATNAFADTLANQTTNLYDNYYNRQANNLSALMNTSNNLYNYMTGLGQMSQNGANSVSNYNLGKYQLENKNNSNMWASIASSLANAGGNMGSAYIQSKSTPTTTPST